MLLNVDSYIEKNYKGEKKENFYISNKDTHTSKFANKIYAEALFNEIMSNSKHGFRKLFKK